MAKVSGKPIDRIMPTFIMQSGVPLITVSGSCHVDYIPLQVEQERFYISPSGNSQSNDAHKTGELWQIPVCTRAAQPWPSKCFLVSGKKQEVSINNCSWQMANRDAKGYYRVFYRDQNDLLRIAAAAEKQLTVP